MMKNFIIILLCLCAFSVCKAQIHFGATTAVNTTFVLDKGLSEDPRYNSTMTYEFAPVGFSFGVDFGNRFGLQLESIIANQGQIFEVIDAAKKVVGERNIDLSYFQMPLLMKFMASKASRARTNFSFGPQLSILREGVETLQYNQSAMIFPEGTPIVEQSDGTYTITDPNGVEIMGATMNNDGSYNVPELPTTVLLSSSAERQINKFRNTEVQLAFSLGVDIDISKNLYLSSIIRGNYSFSDMRNGELIDNLRDSNLKDIFNKRANLLVGVQLGLNYVVGGTRFFKFKE